MINSSSLRPKPYLLSYNLLAQSGFSMPGYLSLRLFPLRSRRRCLFRKVSEQLHWSSQLKRVELITLEVEIAANPQELQAGLSGRASLPEMQGMLFDFSLYGDSVSIPFYMKGTYILLSIAFIFSDGIHNCGHSGHGIFETLHYPTEAYHYALEVNHGWFDRQGVGVGDKA